MRLPKKFVDELGLKPGDQIDIVSTVGRRVEVCLNPQPERELAPIEPNGSPTSEA